MSRYALLAPNAWNKIQMNAGILCENFDPATGVVGGILGVTSGGINFTASNTYTDFGEDMDNVPKNTMELKRFDSADVKVSGTFATVDANLASRLAGAADITNLANVRKITPRSLLDVSDFQTLWLVGDYSSDMNESTGGFCAVKLLNTLSTGGFQMQTTDKEKGKFAFEFTGHVSYDNPSQIPYEVHIKMGDTAPTFSLEITPGKNSYTVRVLDYTLGTGESFKIKYESADNLPNPVVGSTLTGYAAMSSNPMSNVGATEGKKIVVAVADSNSNCVAFGTAIAPPLDSADEEPVDDDPEPIEE